ncbi:MAG: hypothetical protein B6U95_06635 [Thermofilum sp. ex4484_82]|nr:MAG: hypothetical protein B6U95_06635 [Thermofilum sp. ex4484_82]OYT37416.1 MAG: hypothetical protein B6U96_06630 [Archaeoglobales archaeon ex4484_92]
MPFFKKPKTTEKILEQVKIFVDVLDRKPVPPGQMRDIFKKIAEEVSNIPLEKRDEIAEQIKRYFEERMEYYRRWQREEEKKIKDLLLKEIKYRKEIGAPIPPELVMRVKQIDMTIKIYRARAYAIENIQQQVLTTVREGQTTREIMKGLIAVNQTLMTYLEETGELMKEYEEVVGEAVETTSLDEIMKTYLPEEIPRIEREKEEAIKEDEKTLEELMETYLKGKKGKKEKD